MAKAAEDGGADAISLINTLTGMKIDIHKRAFAPGQQDGGFSGPAIKPGGSAHGLPDSPGSAGAHYRHGRYQEWG